MDLNPKFIKLGNRTNSIDLVNKGNIIITEKEGINLNSNLS